MCPQLPMQQGQLWSTHSYVGVQRMCLAEEISIVTENLDIVT